MRIEELSKLYYSQLIDLVMSLELTIEQLDKEILEMKAAIKEMDVTSAYKGVYY